MEAGSEVWEARKHLAWGNTTVALFSFSAACLVFLGSYYVIGPQTTGDSLFVEARTVVLILFLLLFLQSVYYVLVHRKILRTPHEATKYPLLDTENTYFIALAAGASACVYVIAVVGNISSSVFSALAATMILATFFVIQLAYVVISERRERKA